MRSTYIPMSKLPRLLRTFIGSRLGVALALLDSTPSFMELRWENSPLARCLTFTWVVSPGTPEEGRYILADFQYHGRRYFLAPYLLGIPVLSDFSRTRKPKR